MSAKAFLFSFVDTVGRMAGTFALNIKVRRREHDALKHEIKVDMTKLNRDNLLKLKGPDEN